MYVLIDAVRLLDTLEYKEHEFRNNRDFDQTASKSNHEK